MVTVLILGRTFATFVHTYTVLLRRNPTYGMKLPRTIAIRRRRRVLSSPTREIFDEADRCRLSKADETNDRRFTHRILSRLTARRVLYSNNIA